MIIFYSNLNITKIFYYSFRINPALNHHHLFLDIYIVDVKDYYCLLVKSKI